MHEELANDICFLQVEQIHQSLGIYREYVFFGVPQIQVFSGPQVAAGPIQDVAALCKAADQAASWKILPQ